MNNFLLEKFYDKEYVLIDLLKYNDESIFYFGSVDSEIFCYKKDNKFIPITDSFKINLIKNLFDLNIIKRIYNLEKDDLKKSKKTIRNIRKFKRKYYREILEQFNDDEKSQVVSDGIKNFEEIRDRFNLNIDIENIKEILDKINFFTIEYFGTSPHCLDGFYNPNFHNIVYKKLWVKEKSQKGSRTKLHEMIHAITGKKIFEYNTNKYRGFLEGETENLVEDFFDEKKSSYIYSEENDVPKRMHVNFSENASYPSIVLIIKQMEAILGKKSYQSILDGDMSFEKEFSKRYGILLTTFLKYKSNRLLSFKKIKNHKIEYLNEIQNILMEKCFNKDFKEIDSLEECETFFQKLRNFELKRGRMEISGKEDNAYEIYYNHKLEQAKKLLLEKNVNQAEIDSFIENNAYKRQKFYPVYSDREFEDRALDCINGEFRRQVVDTGKKIDYNEYDLYLIKTVGYSFRALALRKGTNEGFYLSKTRYVDDKTEEILVGDIERNVVDGEADRTELLKKLDDLGIPKIKMNTNGDSLNYDMVVFLNEKLKHKNRYSDETIQNIQNALLEYGIELEEDSLHDSENQAEPEIISHSELEEKNEQESSNENRKVDTVNEDNTQELKEKFLKGIVTKGKNFVRLNKLTLWVDRISQKIKNSRDERETSNQNFDEKL